MLMTGNPFVICLTFVSHDLKRHALICLLHVIRKFMFYLSMAHMLDLRAVTKRDVIACNAHINYQTVLFS